MRSQRGDESRRDQQRTGQQAGDADFFLEQTKRDRDPQRNLEVVHDGEHAARHAPCAAVPEEIAHARNHHAQIEQNGCLAHRGRGCRNQGVTQAERNQGRKTAQIEPEAGTMVRRRLRHAGHHFAVGDLAQGETKVGGFDQKETDQWCF